MLLLDQRGRGIAIGGSGGGCCCEIVCITDAKEISALDGVLSAAFWIGC